MAIRPRSRAQRFIDGFRYYYNSPSLPPAWGYMGAIVGVIIALAVVVQLFVDEPVTQTPDVPLAPIDSVETIPNGTLPSDTSPTVPDTAPSASTPEDLAAQAALAAVSGDWSGIGVADGAALPEPVDSTTPYEVIEVLPIEVPSGATDAFWVTVGPKDASGPPFPVEVALANATVVQVTLP